jgi:nickel/cobalt transporter (NiCoT) family protein
MSGRSFASVDDSASPSTMNDLPTSWSALCALVFLLGLRHGFDADHLAAIDGLTRLAARHRRAHARSCGALFSLGHGIVVVGIAAMVGALSERWEPPAWLDAFGAWGSIAFLLLIGVANLRAVLMTAPGHLVSLVGIRGPLWARLLPARNPLGVAAVGALFAVSFDTISQAALFAMTAAQFGGLLHALVLGLLFVLGMLVADGLNGWWISRLIARADEIAVLASRIMSVAVSGVSLLVAALGVARLLSPALEHWSEGREQAFGGVVVLVIALSYLAARALAMVSLARGQPAA